MPFRGSSQEPKEDVKFKRAPWTQDEQDALHDMVRDYMWTKTLRKKAGWFFVWFLGVPGAVLAFWEPLERLIKLFSWKVK